MKILTSWLRTYLPSLAVSDRQLADDLTLRGIAVEGVHPLGDGHGHLFEMDITTNRVDAMNHFGIAREAATIYNLPLTPLTQEPSPVNLADVILGKAENPYRAEDASLAPDKTRFGTAPASFELRIDAPDLCGRFTARILRNVTIAPSSGRIKTFFDLLGQKQISNAVDASNFTLLGMGHPTHAFDLDKIEGGLVVRLAHRGERLKLLDGAERTLEPDDLVIADERKALSLAGVMGGWSSMITPDTKNILVESAWFDPATIRRSSRRHLLHTDASHRFERGADFDAAPIANQLVTDLILEHGGEADPWIIDLVMPGAAARTSSRPPIPLSIIDVQRHLGATLDDTPTQSALTSTLVRQYLSALGCTLTASTLGTPSIRNPETSPSHAGESAGTFQVSLPSWRLDLERPIDLIEEVARVFGYNRFANTLPAPLPVLAYPTHVPEHAVRTRLLALGFSEAVSSTFSSAADSHLFTPAPAATGQGSPPPATHVPLENPLSEEASNLRPSLLPGMLNMLAGNLNRDVSTARLFEQGDIFAASTESQIHTVGLIEAVLETPSLALGLTSATPHATSLHAAADAPIFELKGVIESVASLFTLPGGPEALSFTTANAPAWLQPGRSATAHLGARRLAHFGELSRAESARRKLRQPVFLAVLDLALLYALPLRSVTAHDLSRFQAVERDFSFFFPDSTHWHTVAAAIHALALPNLQRLTPIEIFRDAKGKAIPAGQHSLLLRAVFQSHTRTLTEEELTRFWTRIIDALTDLGGTLRAP